MICAILETIICSIELCHYAERCDHKNGQFYDVSIPVNVNKFIYNFNILDDDIYETEERLTVVIDSATHGQIRIVRPYAAAIIINDDEKRK